MNTIIILIFVIILLFYTNECRENFVLEFCDEKDEYIKPTVHEGIITEEEAEYILKEAEKLFEQSEVVGTGVDLTSRRSSTAWLRKKEDEKIRKIIQRICDLTNMPIENAEDLQVVKYLPNGYYRPHHDSCCDKNDACKKFEEDGGQRVVTMVIYLNDGFKGGETNFPNLKMRLKAPKCGGLLFYPLEKGGNRCHPHALHEGTDVIEGVKYIANVWIRENKFRE